MNQNHELKYFKHMLQVILNTIFIKQKIYIYNVKLSD